MTKQEANLIGELRLHNAMKAALRAVEIAHLPEEKA